MGVSLMMVCNPYSTVKQWSTTIATTERYCLNVAFRQALQVTSSPTTYFFDNVYIPVKIPTAAGMPDDFTYEKIGWDIDDIVDIYTTYYGPNFLIEPLVPDGVYEYSNSIGLLTRRIKSVFQMNKGKYLKLIELQGYEYNPLYNVDGTEDYTYLENQGMADKKTSHNIDKTVEATLDSTQTTNVNLYDSTTREAQEVVTSGQPSSTETGLAANNYDEEEYTHKNAKNLNASNVEEEYNATSTFGQDIKGGDKFHTERKVRKGNIGVTKTQELIEAERENLKFVVLEEFFKDLNEQILIGVF